MVNNPKKFLLVYPGGSTDVYSQSKIRFAAPSSPPLSLASLGGVLLKAGQEVKLIDMGVCDDPEKRLLHIVEEFKPDYAGVSFNSVLSSKAVEIAKKIKKISPLTLLIGGGVHATLFPEDCLKKSFFDILIIGEGEKTIMEIVEGEKKMKDIAGVAYFDGREVIVNQRQPLIEDLDKLPMPAWQLFDLSKYHMPRMNAKRNPVGSMETSRGCPFGCCFCNKSVFSEKFRAKSPKRVVDEMETMLHSGFREVHILDDGFSIDITRAKDICRLIIDRGLKFPWNLSNGIRVDCLDEELLDLMKKSGCYRVSLGIESGNSQVLSGLGKRITLEQVRRAVLLIKKRGIECLGFFMLGLPGDTKKTMQDTIDFAKDLKLDLAKASIFMPLPGTPIFEDWDKKGLIKTYDWSKYIFHDGGCQVYDHPSLSQEAIGFYYDKFYRNFYFDRSFILKRIGKAIKNGSIFSDGYYFLKMLGDDLFNP